MKEAVHVAAVQYDPLLLKKRSNLERMSEIVASTVKRLPFDLFVFPELATTGYVPTAYSEEFHRSIRQQSDYADRGTTFDVMCDAARSASCFIAIGFCESEGSEMYNSLALIDPTGTVAAVHRKVHLWTQETNYFKPGDRFDVIATELGTVGLSICFDSRLPENTRAQAMMGAEIAICAYALVDDPSLSAADSISRRASTRAIENGIFWVACNRTGRDETGIFNGGSAIADPAGALIGSTLEGDTPIVHTVMRSSALELARRESEAMQRSAVVEVRPISSLSGEGH